MNKIFHGRFFDGKQSQPFPVFISVIDNTLHLTTNDKKNPLLLSWDIHHIHILSEPHENRAALLGYLDTDARLLVEEEVYHLLFPHIPSHQKRYSIVPHNWYKISLFILLSLIIFISFLIIIPLTAPLLATLVPISWEERLGKYVMKSIVEEEQYQECISPTGVAALNKIVKRLTASLPLFSPPLEVKVFQFPEEEVNAFAVPGHHIVVMSGLLKFASTPEELAGVLAHEMGHVLQKHPIQSLIRQTGLEAIIIAAFGSTFGPASHLLNLKYDRGDELEADQIALSLLYQAQISREGFLSFFRKLKGSSEEETQGIFTYLSSHPSHDERMQRIQAYSLTNKKNILLTPAEWKALKNICKTTVPFKVNKK